MGPCSPKKMILDDNSSVPDDDSSVPDLTPQQLNDPCEHILNVFTKLCTHEFDLGDDRPPRVVHIGVVSHGATPLDKNGRGVSPLVEFHPLLDAAAAWVTRNIASNHGSASSPEHLTCSPIKASPPRPAGILKRPSHKTLQSVMVVAERRTRRMFDALVGTVVALLVTVSALRHLGFPLDMSFHVSNAKESKAIRFSRQAHDRYAIPMPPTTERVVTNVPIDLDGVCIDTSRAMLQAQSRNELIASSVMVEESGYSSQSKDFFCHVEIVTEEVEDDASSQETEHEEPP